MEIDPQKNEKLKTLDKSIDLGAIFDDNSNTTGDDVYEVDHNDQSTHSSELKVKKRKKNRCPFEGCRKRLTLTDITCKCKQKFCMKHRYPEDHECNYDYKSEARKKLKRENFVVSGTKVEKI